jgi:uncharacterized protein
MNATFVGVENKVQSIDEEQISNPLNIFAIDKF